MNCRYYFCMHACSTILLINCGALSWTHDIAFLLWTQAVNDLKFAFIVKRTEYTHLINDQRYYVSNENKPNTLLIETKFNSLFRLATAICIILLNRNILDCTHPQKRNCIKHTTDYFCNWWKETQNPSHTTFVKIKEDLYNKISSRMQHIHMRTI